MTQKHDFEAALDEFEFLHGRVRKLYGEHLYDNNHLAILFALKLAQKVTGEPKTSMVHAAIEASKSFSDSEEDAQAILFGASITFKAMVNQAIKEIESEHRE